MLLEFNCKTCKETKDISCFYIRTDTKKPRADCNECFSKYTKEKYQELPAEKRLLMNARKRSKKLNIKFEIEEKDIIIPEYCPVFNIKLDKFNELESRDTSPSLDRIDPLKGYIIGNIIVTSFKANRMKNNATIDELKMLYEFYSKL